MWEKLLVFEREILKRLETEGQHCITIEIKRAQIRL